MRKRGELASWGDMQEARDLLKFLQWGHPTVSRRFLDAAIRFLTEASSSGNLTALAAVRAPHAACETGCCSAA